MDYNSEPPLSVKIVLLLAAFGFMLVLAFGAAHGAEHDHTGHQPGYEQQMHDEFYKDWMMPDNRDSSGVRISSCCSDQDCFPTTVRQRTDGTWEAKRRPGALEGLSEWVQFEPKKLEQNYQDMKESPDGQSHACISAHSDHVYCATLGSGM